MDISHLLNEIRASRRYENQIVHIEEIPAREALYSSLELKTQVKAVLSGMEINALYSHQAEAIGAEQVVSDDVCHGIDLAGGRRGVQLPHLEAEGAGVIVALRVQGDPVGRLQIVQHDGAL